MSDLVYCIDIYFLYIYPLDFFFFFFFLLLLLLLLLLLVSHCHFSTFRHVLYFLFQAVNDVPIHLKGGPADKVLFGATVVMCAVGLGSCFKFYYDMAFPKRIE